MNRLLKIAVLCNEGIGDALILSIASRHLTLLGHRVTTFSRHPLSQFGSWLGEAKVAQYPDSLEDLVTSFDALLLQHDNTPRARALAALRSKLPVYIFYGSYRVSKHGPLQEQDYAFHESINWVQNVRQGTQHFFGGEVGYENILSAPSHLKHQKYSARVILHSGASNASKEWPLKKFELLSAQLAKEGYEPLWLLQNQAPRYTFEKMAELIYESGYFIGNDTGATHLASYCQIPHLILTDRVSSRWIPGWYQGHVVAPASWIPNWKVGRWRQRYWKQWIRVSQVLRQFDRCVMIRKNAYER